MLNKKLLINLLFFINITIIHSTDDQPVLRVQELKRIKIVVDSNSVRVSKTNPFNNDFMYIIVVKLINPTTKLYDFELHIASFKQNTVTKVDSSVTRVADYNSDIFWVKDYLILYDSGVRKYFYWNNSLQDLPEIDLEQGYEKLLINEYYPNMIVAISSEKSKHSLVSVDFGENYFTLPLNSRNYYWISESHFLIFIQIIKNRGSEDKILRGRSYLHSKNEQILSVSNILSYKIVEKYIFIIKTKNDQQPNEYFMYDVSLQKLNQIVMTERYENPVFQSIYYDKDYFFIVLQNLDKNCILRSHRYSLKFYSLICGVESFQNDQDCEFAFSNKPHVIYANILNDLYKKYETLYSADDGDNWNRLSIQNYKSIEYFDHSYLRLKLIYNVRRSNNLNPFMFDLFSGTFFKDNREYSRKFHSRDVGIVIKYANLIDVIYTINHDEIQLIKHSGDYTFSMHYSSKKGYKRDLFKDDRKIHSRKNFFNEQHFSLISLETETIQSSKTNLNIIFIDLKSLMTPLCDNSHYRVVEDVCVKGTLYRYMKKQEDTICFTPQDFHFVQILSQCACSFDENYCKLQFKLENQECKPRDITKDTASLCNDGRYKLSHLNGLRKILDHQCEYDFSRDNEDLYSKNCGYLNDPDFVKIILSSSSFTVYMDEYGKHFPRPPIYEESILDNSIISNIWDYDVNRDVLYFARDNIIFELENAYIHSSKRKLNEIYWMEHIINGIIVDSTSGCLFVSDVTFNVFEISLKTNYKKIYPINGRIMSFNKTSRTISFIDESQNLCTQEVYLNSTCLKLKEPVIYGYFYSETETAFLLYFNNSLIVQGGLTKIHIITEIPEVSFIRQIENSIYFLSKTTLYLINIKYPSIYYKIVDLKTSSITMLFVRKSYKNIFDDILHCDYISEVNSKFERKCVCPIGSIQRENECECVNNMKYQKSLCLGFFCNNRKCLRNNIKCDGLDDCGDSSDEKGCKKICKNTEHLCGDTCLAKNKVCFEINPKSNIQSCDQGKIKKYIYIINSVLVVSIILLIPFIVKKLYLSGIIYKAEFPRSTISGMFDISKVLNAD